MKITDLKSEIEIDPLHIQWVIERMANDVIHDIRIHGVDEFVMVVVLKGGVFFAVDLATELFTQYPPAPPMKMLYVTADSYRYEMDPGDAIHIDFPQGVLEEIKGKYVLIVDDIADTGRTLDSIIKRIAKYAKVVKTAVMLCHPPYISDFVGVRVYNPDLFAVGYGMDFQGKYRNDPSIRMILKEQLKSLEGA